MVDAAMLDFKNVSITGLDEDISTKLRRQIHHVHLDIIA